MAARKRAKGARKSRGKRGKRRKRRKARTARLQIEFVLKPSVSLRGPYVGYLNRSLDKSRGEINDLVQDTLQRIADNAAKP